MRKEEEKGGEEGKWRTTRGRLKFPSLQLTKNAAGLIKIKFWWTIDWKLNLRRREEEGGRGGKEEKEAKRGFEKKGSEWWKETVAIKYDRK